MSFLLYCLLSLRGGGGWGLGRFMAEEVIVFLLIVPRRHSQRNMSNAYDDAEMAVIR